MVMKTKYDFWAKIADLCEGDVVQCAGMASGPFSTAIVRKIECEASNTFGTLILWRPFGHYNAAIRSCYVGIEDNITYMRDSSQTLWVYQGERPDEDKVERCAHCGRAV